MLAILAALAGPVAPTASAAPARAADTGRVTLPCVASGVDATGPHAKDFCWLDWTNLPLKDGTTPVRITVNGGHIDADVTLTHSTNSRLFVRDYSKTDTDWSRLIPAYRITGNTALGFDGGGDPTVFADRKAAVTFDDITPVPDDTGSAVNVLKDFRLAFGDAETMSSNQSGGWEQTELRSDKPLNQLGWVGDPDPAHSYQVANTGWGTTHVTLAGGSKPAGTYPISQESRGGLVAGAAEPSTFTVDFQQRQASGNSASAIAVGVYMPYTVAYPLHYDGNDGTGTLPKQSN